ncbi:hypothetical protein OEW28_01830 [Defluviimonas sp. WL0002]|uniref:Uncharacterized protein n=1 Tax=Albidovulum marisflavi TaxID=2984159 RepID=A0ABT2Z8E8_9RHOB|nr:hypothetical protein [Defluviimonas sp. WL0002]MCV2867366.1 hypothetical protein [Defluviimonas sp. WL0002]
MPHDRSSGTASDHAQALSVRPNRATRPPKSRNSLALAVMEVEMRLNRNAVVATTTLLAAFAIGFWVQNDAAMAQRAAAGADVTAMPGLAKTGGPDLAGAVRYPPDFPDGQVTALISEVTFAHRLPEVAASAPAAPSAAAWDFSAYGIACRRPDLTLSPAPDGILHIAFEAPCLPGTPVDVSYGAVVFRLATDTLGRASIDVPALASQTRIEANFADGSRVIRLKTVPDFDERRTTILWSVPAAWQNQPQDVAFRKVLTSAAGAAVELVSLDARRSGHLAATVTADLCGKPLSGTVLSGASRDGARQITVSMPGCELSGTQVVLNVDRLVRPSVVR